MKLIIFLTFFATYCKLNFSHSIPADFSSFQNYRNVLAYILNQTKSIDDSILDEVDNLVGYAKEPDDYMKNIVDYLTESLINQPQVPYFDEFGAEFYELSCQEIEKELKILFEVSKHFVMKAVKNEETIKMLKNLVSGLAKIGYDNYDLISNVIDTIADNYAAQNHVFMMINNLDDEIQEDIEMIAQYCRKREYEVVEVVVEPKGDGWLDVIMDNGQDLLELIGVNAGEEDEPEFLVFEGNEDSEELQIHDQVEDPFETVESKYFDIFEEFEEPEDPNVNITSENLPPVIINLVIEPESAQNDENVPENQAQNTETEEILDFLAENPEIAEFLLQEIKTEKEKENEVEVESLRKNGKIDEYGELEPEIENETFTNYADDSKKFNLMKINDKDSQNDNWFGDSEINNSELLNSADKNFDIEKYDAENIKTESFNMKKSKHENIYEKGLIVNIPYPDEDFYKLKFNEENNDFDAQDVEDLKGIPVVDESIKIEELEPKVDENLVQEKFEELVWNKPDNGKDKIFIKNSKHIEPEDEEQVEFIQDSELNKLELKKDEEFQSMENNIDKDDSKDKAILNDWNRSEYDDNLLANQLQEIENLKEFVDFETENSDDTVGNLENKSISFENLMKFPKNFWDVPFGFWQSLQNFVENIIILRNFDRDNNYEEDNHKDIIYEVEENNKNDS